VVTKLSPGTPQLALTLEIVVKESPTNAISMMKITVDMAHAKMNSKE
jgi:hypothetical protein